MRNITKTALCCCASTLVALAWASPAKAQATGAPANVDAQAEQDDIVVTARRRDETIQAVPSVVQALTGKDLGKLNLRDFTEVQNLVPGLQLSINANGIGGNAQLRGINFDLNASGNNPSVEFYLNDAPITAGVVLQQIYDIGQVEVVRGPQGTLRGRASPSGAITVVTRKPDLYKLGGYVDLTANHIGSANANGALNIPVINGVAAIRLAGVISQDDGNRIHSLDRSFDARDPYGETRSGRVSALIEPSDWLRVEGTYQRIDRFSRQFPQVESYSEANPAAATSPALITAADRLAIQARPTVVTSLFDIYNGRAELSLAGQRLIYQFQHYTQTIRSAESQDKANVFPGSDTYQTVATNASSTSHELRLQNQERVLGMFDYVVGAFDYINNSPSQIAAPTIVRLPAVFGGGVAQVVQTPILKTGRSHEQSFFGNLTAHFGESTEVSGGVRLIHYEDASGLFVSGTQVTNDARNDHEVIYTVSIKHEFSSSFMLYANTGTSYRPGVTAVGDFNITPSSLEKSFLNLPAERSQSYEFGLKSSLFDHRVRLNVSAYYQTFKNYPYRAPGNGVFYVNSVAVRDPATGAITGLAQQISNFNFVAAVPVTVYGAEAEIAANITSRWSVGLVVSYSLGKIKSGVIPCNDLDGDGLPDTSGATPTVAQLQTATGGKNISACTVSQRSAFQSPFAATVQSEYSIPLTHHVDGFLRGLFNLTGASLGDPTNAFDQVKGYGLLNLFLGARDPNGRWELTAYAKNITDEVRVLTRTTPLSTSYQQLGFGGFGPTGPIFTGPTGVSTTSTYTGITTTPAREFGFNFKFRFGSR